MNVFASGALSDAGELGFCIWASMGGLYPDYAPYRLVLLDAYSSPLRPGVFVELRDMLLAWGQRCHARGIPGLYAGEVLAEASALSGLAANALPLPPARVDLSLAAAPHIVAGHVRVIRELIDKGASRPLGAVLDGAGDPDDPLKVAAAKRIKYAIRLPANRVLQERIAIRWHAQLGGCQMKCGVPMRASAIRREAGRSLAGSSPRWNGIRVSFIRALDSSSPTWRGPPRISSPSTTSAEPANNGSKRGKARSNGRGCHGFAANAVRLQLHALAYNLGNFLRTLATPEPIKDWSMTSLKEKLIKIGAKVVSHGRYVAFQMAEVAIPRNLFADILRLIAELRSPPPPTPA